MVFQQSRPASFLMRKNIDKHHMKRHVSFFKTAGIAMLCLLAAVVPALNSCQKKSTDVTDLLKTVPSSAATVVSINLASLLEKGGCKVEGSEIKPNGEIEKWLAKDTQFSPTQKEVIRMVLSGESGIDPIGAIFFTDAYNSYVTVALADTDKFIAFAEKSEGKTFTDNGNGVRVCGNFAIKGAQAWMSVTKAGQIDANAVSNYSELEESRSFLTTPYSVELSKMSVDIAGYGQMKGLLRNLDIRNSASVMLLSGLVYENASAFSFTIDFKKGAVNASAIVLNDKGEPAKYLLPTDKIDVDKVKSLGTDANAVVAFSISKSLVEKVQKLGEQLAGQAATSMMESFNSLDGTAAIAFTDPSSPDKGISGLVTTDGKASLELMQLISQLGNTQKDDKLVRFSKGALSGNIKIADAADLLKGSSLGFVIDASAVGDKMAETGLKTMSLTAKPDKGGMRIDIDLKTTNQNENSLLTILK